MTDEIVTPVDSNDVLDEAALDRIRALDITSCDFCPDGCVDPECYRCYSPLRPECLRQLAANLATAAGLCRSFALARGTRQEAWRPGCGWPAPW